MFPALLAFFIAFVAGLAFFSSAVIYHLWHYTLPGWSAPKVVIPAYLAATLLFLGFALAAFLHIPF